MQTETTEEADDDGEIVSIPAGADLAACEAQGRADYAAGVRLIDCPYVCGYPLYAWEKGWEDARDGR